MSSASARAWQAPALEAAHVLRPVVETEGGRGDQMVRWAQRKALAVLAEAESSSARILEEARREGYRQGQEEARLVADRTLHDELDQRREAMSSDLLELRASFEAERSQMVAEFESALGRLSLQVGQVLALGELRQDGRDLWPLVSESLQSLGGPTTALVRVGCRSQLESLRKRAEGSFDVIHDPSLAAWDLRVESTAGHAVICYRQRLSEVEAVLLGRLDEAA